MSSSNYTILQSTFSFRRGWSNDLILVKREQSENLDEELYPGLHLKKLASLKLT